MRTRLTITTITAVTFAGVLTLNAQSPQSQGTPRTQPQTDRQTGGTDTQARGSNQAVKITGCLQTASASGGSMTGGSASGGSTGGGSTGGGSTGAGSTGGGSASGGSARGGSASGSRNSNEQYVLTNVKMGQGSSTSAMGLASSYQVMGVSDTEMQRHLNQQVEVTGRINTSGSNMGSGNRGSGAGGSGTTGSGTTGSGTTGSGTTGSGTAGSGTTGAGASGMSGHGDMPSIQATNIRMVSQTCPANQ